MRRYSVDINVKTSTPYLTLFLSLYFNSIYTLNTHFIITYYTSYKYKQNTALHVQMIVINL